MLFNPSTWIHFHDLPHYNNLCVSMDTRKRYVTSNFFVHALHALHRFYRRYHVKNFTINLYERSNSNMNQWDCCFKLDLKYTKAYNLIKGVIPRTATLIQLLPRKLSRAKRRVAEFKPSPHVLQCFVAGRFTPRALWITQIDYTE